MYRFDGHDTFDNKLLLESETMKGIYQAAMKASRIHVFDQFTMLNNPEYPFVAGRILGHKGEPVAWLFVGRAIITFKRWNDDKEIEILRIRMIERACTNYYKEVRK